MNELHNKIKDREPTTSPNIPGQPRPSNHTSSKAHFTSTKQSVVKDSNIAHRTQISSVSKLPRVSRTHGNSHTREKMLRNSSIEIRNQTPVCQNSQGSHMDPEQCSH